MMRGVKAEISSQAEVTASDAGQRSSAIGSVNNHQYRPFLVVVFCCPQRAIPQTLRCSLISALVATPRRVAIVYKRFLRRLLLC
uniref:Uncharacterized protein n=1 Tax=Steinernema glaseri TaxID=37863 RepID=A0A1I8AS63_9BILA